MQIPRPTLSRVLIEIDPPESKIGSIVMPAGTQRRLGYFTGIVISIGPGAPLAGGAIRSSELKPGDRVMYGIHHDLQHDQLKGYNKRVHDHYKDGLIETDTRRLAIIEEDDIFATMEETNAQMDIRTALMAIGRRRDTIQKPMEAPGRR